MLRVGFVGIQPPGSPLYAAFLERMAELGYQEGRNFTFEYIQINVDDYEKNYRELAARRVDVFLAVGNEPALTRSLWLRMVVPSPFWPSISIRWRKAMATPAHVPGALPAFSYASSSSLQNASRSLAKSSVPPLLSGSDRYGSREQRDAAAEAAAKSGFEPQMIDVKSPQDYDRAFSAMDGLRDQPVSCRRAECVSGVIVI